MKRFVINIESSASTKQTVAANARPAVYFVAHSDKMQADAGAMGLSSITCLFSYGSSAHHMFLFVLSDLEYGWFAE